MPHSPLPSHLPRHALTIHTRATPARQVIELAGDLDHHTAADVHDLLPDLALRPGQQRVIDLARLTFCDSSGIIVVIAARNHATAADAALVLAAVPDRVSRILRNVGLEQIFPTRPTAQAAETAWTPTA
ncbi:STAS domain-containing protein [Streptomyces sp. NPDC057543]|uniref:STAS domain-containing protein n=1 Tax=Streptomyces sp. NPDC057543 TaxID=3346163 RepID=UPI0036C77D18